MTKKAQLTPAQRSCQVFTALHHGAKIMERAQEPHTDLTDAECDKLMQDFLLELSKSELRELVGDMTVKFLSLAEHHLDVTGEEGEDTPSVRAYIEQKHAEDHLADGGMQSFTELLGKMFGAEHVIVVDARTPADVPAES